MNIRLLLSSCLLPVTVCATIWEVYPGNSIQAVVHETVNGDTILIYDGLYQESVVLYGKTLTIGSLFLLDGDTNHVYETAIEADTSRIDTQSCFIYCYGEQPGGRLVGLSLWNGRGTAYMYGSAPLRLGGGIYIDSASVSIEWCRLEGCVADHGGGIWAQGWTTWDSSFALHLTVDHCLLYDCKATYQAGSFVSGSGGLDAGSVLLRLSNTVFDSDTCTGFGGGLMANPYCYIDSCQFLRCHALIAGGANVSSLYGHVADCVFDANTPSDHNTGHLMLSGQYELVTRCVFRNCVSQGSAIMCTGYLERFIGNIIEDNHSTLWTGIFMDGSSYVGEVAYNIIRRNSSPQGGALYCYQGSRNRVHHNIFEDSYSDSLGWGSAVVSMGSRPALDSNIFRGNNGTTISINYPPLNFLHAENNYWGHPSGPYHPTLNPGGQGDTLLSDSVLFIPWLTEPPDTTMPNDVPDREHPTISRTWELAELYPNPFNSSLQIVLAGFTGSDFELTLHNLLGQVVDVIERGPLTGGRFTYQAPAYLASGVYFVRAADRHTLQTRKVVLMK